MCGIAGLLSSDFNNNDELNTLLDSILVDQYQRGPDFKCKIKIEESNYFALLGHNRLSILDLSEMSNQPFQDKSSGDWIVFNGEIYNYIELKKLLFFFCVCILLI